MHGSPIVYNIKQKKQNAEPPHDRTAHKDPDGGASFFRTSASQNPERGLVKGIARRGIVKAITRKALMKAIARHVFGQSIEFK